MDLDVAREVFHEAATLLGNGLALDGLDEHDAGAVVDASCLDLAAADAGAAIRERSQKSMEAPGGVHEPERVARAYVLAAAILQL